MNDRIYADLSGMAEAADGFGQSLSKLETSLSQLDSQLQVMSSWCGQARDAYLSAHGQWRTEAESMRNCLAGLHGVLQTAHANYTRARAANLSMWQGRS